MSNDKGASHDPFGASSCGLTSYEDFLSHFPMHTLAHDVNTYGITFSYPSIPLDLSRYGVPHLSDLLFPSFPITMYHMSNKSSVTNKPWLFEKGKKHTGVALTFQLTIDRPVYDSKTSLSNLHVDVKPYKGSGKNVNQIMEFYTSDKSKRLMHCYLNWVLFDLETRLPVNLPESVNRSMKSLDLMDYPINRLLADSPPSDAFRFPVTVVYGNLDCNGHMTSHWYVRHAMDAIVMAITSKAPSMKSITTTQLEAGAHRLRLQYMKECCYGDKLELLVWQHDIKLPDGGVEKEARCWLEKGGQVACKMAVKFYDRK